MHSVDTSSKLDQPLKAILPSERLGWISVALFSFLCPIPGNLLLKFLVCRDLNMDVYYCLPSPSLYTSVIEGFKVALPVVLLIGLIIVLLQSRYKRHI